jgi:signal transduction histidine kinase
MDVEPGLWVEGDSDRLQQIVLNLLDNARKYTPPGGQIVLRANSEMTSIPVAQNLALSRAEGSELQTHNWVVIEVEDTGVGIPADALPQLFDRFYRVDSARARASGGSGLGLAIVQAIVQAHHGQIDIQSTLGVGTSVTIHLPRLPTPSTQPASAQNPITSAPLQSLAE